MKTNSSQTRTVRRPFLDFEREERWLGEMDAQGWELSGYAWGRYRFVRGASGTWTYRIVLLPKSANAEQSRAFLDSMRAKGAEMVATHANWVYLRRRADAGAFEVFSDEEARIAHYSRIATMYSSISAALMPLVVVALSATVRGTTGPWVAPVLLFQLALLAAVAWAGALQYRRAARLRAT